MRISQVIKTTLVLQSQQPAPDMDEDISSNKDNTGASDVIEVSIKLPTVLTQMRRSVDGRQQWGMFHCDAQPHQRVKLLPSVMLTHIHIQHQILSVQIFGCQAVQKQTRLTTEFEDMQERCVQDCMSGRHRGPSLSVRLRPLKSVTGHQNWV